MAAGIPIRPPVTRPVPNPELEDLWRSVIDPEGIGMVEALARDIAGFTREPVQVVLDRMAGGKLALKDLWEKSAIDPGDPEAVAAFYRDQFVEAYELADWHSGRTNGFPPLNYARAARLARALGARRVLDFGSGIGTGSLCLAEQGCEVHSADIARELLRFTGYRLEQRGFTPHLVDLGAGEQPRRAYYDLITCFDVLEHIPDQLGKLRELSSWLVRGGRLLVNLMVDSSHPDRPMHISSAGDWERLVRRTPLRPDWALCEGEMQVLVRTPSALFRNAAVTLRDDVVGRWFSS